VKAASVAGPSKITVGDTITPNLNPGDILVQMKACGICGSDIEKVFGRYGKQSMRLGHEPAGVIVEVGDGPVDSDGSGTAHNKTKFSKGDRVFTHHHVPCGTCRLCLHGCETMCDRYSQTNLQPCGLSEMYVVPAYNISRGGVLKIQNSTTFAEAAMIEPLACCLRAWKKFKHRPGDSVAVFGVGPTGIMHAMIAIRRGSSVVICLDVNEYRLDFARSIGATHTVNLADSTNNDEQIRDVMTATTTTTTTTTATGGGVDVSIVATGSLDALKEAFHITRKGGTIMMFGVPSRNAAIDLDMGYFYAKELTLATSYAASDADTADALRLIESGEINVKPLITHTYALSDSQKAFEHARSGDNAMKIIITDDHTQC